MITSSPALNVTPAVLAIVNQNTTPFNVNAPTPARLAPSRPPAGRRPPAAAESSASAGPLVADDTIAATPASAGVPFDVRRVMQSLPHRYPMLLVDRVDEMELDERIVATKAVTMNELFFQGHFPGRPIMPGVMIIEALAQAAGVLAVESLGQAHSGKLVYFMSIENAKFRVPVEPGVLLRLECDADPEARAGLEVRRPGLCRRQGRHPGRFHRDDPDPPAA